MVVVAAGRGWGVGGGFPSSAPGFTGQCAVWQGLGRERQGAGGGAGKGPGWLKEGGTRPGGTGARPLWVERSPSIPHPSQPRCLPGALPSSPVSCRGSALKLRTREGPELGSMGLAYIPLALGENRGPGGGTALEDTQLR